MNTSYRRSLFCGTLSFCLIGGIPQMQSVAASESLAVVQQSEKISGTVPSPIWTDVLPSM